MSIIVTRNGRDAEKLEEEGFEYEDKMQEYIDNNPLVIPLHDIKENLKLLIITREFPVYSGSIDHLAVDNEGNIYVIETKLFKNQDKRKIIGQVLDYGSSIWNENSLDSEWFREKIESFCEKNSKKTFKEKVMESFELSEEEFEGYQQTLKNNLVNGNFRFVVLMDKLDENLKNLIRFINKKSDFAIYVVELEYYKHKDFEIVIPKLFGSEIEKDANVSSPRTRKKWDEQSFFEDAKNKLNDKQLEAVRKLYDFSKDNSNEIFFGTGLTIGSFNPKFFKISVRSLYTIYSDGKLSINVGWLNDNEKTIEQRNNFLKELEKIKELGIPENSQERSSVIIPIVKWYMVADEFIKNVQNLIIK